MDPRSLQAVALEVATSRCQQSALDEIVAGLSREPDVALVRIWLLRPGDRCDTCRLRDDCPTHVDCLHLVASAGESTVTPGLRWDSLDGRFSRFPLTVRKVGMVGGNGKPLLLRFDPDGSDWMVDPDWAQAEGIRVFAGQPLVFRGEVLGVLALFHRGDFDEESFGWLRTFADQAAVAIANGRAFEEIETLRDELALERDYLREEVKVARRFAGLVGASPALRQIEQQVEMVAPTDATVLIQGESGTGKELIASSIHEASARADRSMVRVNCASIPRELFESEFFGHAKGSFTGAVSERAGRFQVANRGTLFLDEVGEIPLELQGKLLRVLQEGQYSRVGEDDVRSTDVRLIAATNRDLRADVAEGRFREDLYYRLGVFPLTVPPLRERPEDVPLLAEHFLHLVTRDRGGAPIKLRRGDVKKLQAYDWPGNVRELRNVIERAVILSVGGRLRIELEGTGDGVASASPAATGESPSIRTDAEMRDVERRNLLAALEAASWKVSGEGGAADLLGLRPTTLTSRLKAFGIRRPR